MLLPETPKVDFQASFLTRWPRKHKMTFIPDSLED